MDLQSLAARDHPFSRWIDVGLRVAGASLLVLLGFFAACNGRVPAQQRESPVGVWLAMLAVLHIWTGLGLLAGGAQWLRPQPVPPRPLFPPSENEDSMIDLLWIGALAGLTLLTTAFITLCERA